MAPRKGQESEDSKYKPPNTCRFPLARTAAKPKMWALLLLLLGAPFPSKAAWYSHAGRESLLEVGGDGKSTGSSEIRVEPWDEVANGEDGSIHICIFSDRVQGLKATLKSTALNAKHPEKIHIWIVTDNTTAVDIVASYLHDTGLTIHPLDLEAVVNNLLLDTGYKPVWTWDVYNSSVKDANANWDPAWANENTAHPGVWDHSTMHMHPLNHLRFYIPYVKEFSRLDRIIFMDDDLIIQGDVQQAWDAKQNLTEGKMLVGACEIWKWGDSSSAFEYSGKNSSYAKSSALAQVGRPIDETYCGPDKDVWCVGSNHWENLNRRSIEINGKPFEPESQPEWNFGFTLFDLGEWKRLELTSKYEKWMRANYEDHIFPETSLMYGLGIPFLAYYDHVSCWDDITEPKIKIRDGFGYITFPEFQFNGLDATYLTSGFVLHYDGWLKPWYSQADPIFAIPYQKTMQNVEFTEYKALMEDPETVKQKLDVRGSFVVLSEPRAGSEWFMSVLDQHPDVCASGTATSQGGRVGFPRDIFLPYDKGTRYFEEHAEKMRMQCYWSFVEKWLPLIAENIEWCDDAAEPRALPEVARPIRRHLPKLCQWAKRHGDGGKQQVANKAELFLEYFERVMKADSESWACQCPKETKVAGTRIMTDWIGKTFKGKQGLNLDRNELDNGTVLAESGVPSLWTSIRTVKPKIIYFKRNIVDELISRHVASATGIFHAKTEDDAAKIRSKGKNVTLKANGISWELLRRGQHRDYIQQKLEASGLDVLYLDYEICRKDMRACMEMAEKFLGVEEYGAYNYKTTRKSIDLSVGDVVGNYQSVLEAIEKKGLNRYLSQQWVALVSKGVNAGAIQAPTGAATATHAASRLRANSSANQAMSKPLKSSSTPSSFIKISYQIYQHAREGEHHQDLRAVHALAQSEHEH
eukprot:jgi/Bigna1/146761/aug1.120_g21469